MRKQQRPPPSARHATSDNEPPSIGRVLLGLTPSGSLPETVDGLMEVINKPESLAQAVAAIGRLGELCGRDVVADNVNDCYGDFHPAIIGSGIGSDPETIRSFAIYAIPLRRALAEHFQARTVDVAMLVDLTALAYWKAIQAERAVVCFLADAIRQPHFVTRAAEMERIKDLAIRQLTRLLEGLQIATGRRLPLDPDADAAKILRFPLLADGLTERKRRTSCG